MFRKEIEQAIIGANVKIFRITKKMTIAALAKKSGLSVSTICSIENKHNYNVTINTLRIIANALDTNWVNIALPSEIAYNK